MKPLLEWGCNEICFATKENALQFDMLCDFANPSTKQQKLELSIQIKNFFFMRRDVHLAQMKWIDTYIMRFSTS